MRVKDSPLTLVQVDDLRKFSQRFIGVKVKDSRSTLERTGINGGERQKLMAVQVEDSCLTLSQCKDSWQWKLKIHAGAGRKFTANLGHFGVGCTSELNWGGTTEDSLVIILYFDSESEDRGYKLKIQRFTTGVGVVGIDSTSRDGEGVMKVEDLFWEL